MRVLGIESSCDETAASIVDDDRTIFSNVILSQHAAHQPYGGVVPEIAARSHIEHMDDVVAEALSAAGLHWRDIDAVAATTGPGLIGGVIVGTMTGKAIASALGKPFISVNHLEGHALTARLSDNVPFPYLLLLVSGGHCQVLAVEGVGKYRKFGTTLDDALGEAFDKTAKMLGLGYPGGPAVERHAKTGNAKRFAYPMPLRGREGCDFSFSGLKTAVRLSIAEITTDRPLAQQDIADICASFQYTVGEVVKDRMQHAFEEFGKHFKAKTLVVAGGVAANQFLRAVLEETAAQHGFTLVAPPLALCTDNAAMIAWVGVEKLRLGLTDPLDTEPRARWPLVNG
jgi:N6-L-threonylcarbamoyladenine synthase